MELIKTNQTAYQEANKRFHEYTTAKEDAEAYINNILGINVSKVDLSKENAFKSILQLFADKHEAKNTMQLKPLKLMDLFDIDFEPIMQKLDYIRLKQVEKPNIKDFSIYAVTPGEIERLQLAKDFEAITKKLDSNITSWSNPYKAPIMYNPATRKMELNHYWIKGTRIR